MPVSLSVLIILESMNSFSVTCDRWKFYCKAALKTQTLRFRLNDWLFQGGQRGLKTWCIEGNEKTSAPSSISSIRYLFPSAISQKIPKRFMPNGNTDRRHRDSHPSVLTRLQFSCTAAEILTQWEVTVPEQLLQVPEPNCRKYRKTEGHLVFTCKAIGEFRQRSYAFHNFSQLNSQEN